MSPRPGQVSRASSAASDLPKPKAVPTNGGRKVDPTERFRPPRWRLIRYEHSYALLGRRLWEGSDFDPRLQLRLPGSELVMPTDPDWTDDLDDGSDYALGVAPTFASRRSRRLALQEAKADAMAIRTRKQPPNKPGLSLLLTHPIILRDLPPHADARPSQSELTRLHRTLTQRDLVILQCLYD